MLITLSILAPMVVSAATMALDGKKRKIDKRLTFGAGILTQKNGRYLTAAK
jgi:hypothetical protein